MVFSGFFSGGANFPENNLVKFSFIWIYKKKYNFYITYIRKSKLLNI